MSATEIGQNTDTGCKKHRDFNDKCIRVIKIETASFVMRTLGNQFHFGGEFWTPSLTMWRGCDVDRSWSATMGKQFQ